MKHLSRFNQLLSVIVVLAFTAGCATLQSPWKDAESANTIAAYEEFLRRYPEDPHADEARSRLDALYHLKRAKDTNTIAAFEQFLAHHPHGELADEARTRLETLKAQIKTIEEITKKTPSSPDNAALARILEPSPEYTLLKQILTSSAQTSCLIRSPDEKELKKTFKNWTGERSKIFIENGQLAWKVILVFVDDPDIDNKTPIRIGDSLYILEMEGPSDQIIIYDRSPSPLASLRPLPLIGVGSKLRFDSQKWVNIFGKRYRSGGIEIVDNGLRFLLGTETQYGGKVFRFDGVKWVKQQ